MEEQPHNDIVQPLSFTDKLAGVFTSPGETFENVRLTGPTSSNWVLPWLIFAAIAIIIGQIVMQNPSLADQLGVTIRDQMNESVAKGEMTREQADQAYEFTRPGSIFFTIIYVGGVTLGSLVALFVIALFYWLIGKTAMGATAPYMKVVEVLGLVFFIAIVEHLVTTLLIFAMDSIHAKPALSIFISDFDVKDKSHLIFSKLNIFTFWDLTVSSIGLSRLFQRDLPKVFVLIFSLWVLWTAFSIITGIRFG
jgi:hypothetical protein